MKIDDLDHPFLTFPDLIVLSQLDRVTIENWMRAGHVVPAQNEAGRNRRFSIADLLRIETINHLRTVLKMQIDMAAQLSAAAIDCYRERASEDAKAIAADRREASNADRYSFKVAVPVAEGVTVVVPIGMIGSVAFGLLSQWQREAEGAE